MEVVGSGGMMDGGEGGWKSFVVWGSGGGGGQLEGIVGRSWWSGGWESGMDGMDGRGGMDGEWESGMDG